MPAKRKSPACETRFGRDKKTRPPAEYNANAALPCPDIEIGSRHPVTAYDPVFVRIYVIQFTYGAKKLRPAKFGGYRPARKVAAKHPRNAGCLARQILRVNRSVD
jgi:hypothetical protein